MVINQPMSCAEWNYKCSRKSSLKIRERNHTGGEPFSCLKCSYKCLTSSTLKSHERIHTNSIFIEGGNNWVGMIGDDIVQNTECFQHYSQYKLVRINVLFPKCVKKSFDNFNVTKWRRHFPSKKIVKFCQALSNPLRLPMKNLDYKEASWTNIITVKISFAFICSYRKGRVN